MVIAAVVAGFVIASLLMETIFSPPREGEETRAEKKIAH